ncbi:1-phosphofructokinase family hexose kinase [Microbacterium aerolatum]|uniref:1-phosphofructokinase n=1 Tax=Microbacterium aerolatum TaxID=153731 RepID=A0A511AQG4_9MICO|nr:PfkB family carbohydrate kinase [Microbacterium aerolatum]GEK87937.1 1-phosphofructokinase [Microbacterium aerolatum]GGB32134.1 1-phosphofructokinase [Microbacterium aerolatum]
MITCLGLSPALDVTYGVPTVTLGGIHRPEWKVALPGGKSLNVARAAQLLGAEVHAITPLGGAVGDDIEAALAAADVPVTRIDTGIATRMCVSVVAESDGGITEFYEHAPAIVDEVWDEVLSALEWIAIGWLVVSGSVPPGREPGLAAALAAASDRGVRLALDLRGEALAAALAETPVELIKVNRAEAEEAVGPGALTELATRLRSLGAARAVVTDGASGSVAVDDADSWAVDPVQAGGYTVGAGDSFLAGLLHGLDQTGELPDALRLAAGAAAANTLRPGAAVFDAEEAMALADRVLVRRGSEAAIG